MYDDIRDQDPTRKDATGTIIGWYTSIIEERLAPPNRSVHFEDDHPPKPSEPIELDRCILDEILRVANPKIVYMGGDKSRPPRVSIDAFALLEWVKSLPKKGGK
jgi:hypothetical protein